MKKRGLLFTLLALVMFVAVTSVNAQLGDVDVSSFTVQNVSGGDAQISVTFIAEDGTSYTPSQLDAGGSVTNPFTLADGDSQQVYVPNIPESMLPSGRYAVMISSSGQVVAQAGVAGTGALRFSGSYIGFSSGSTTAYLPSVAFNFAGWYSMISVQNLGTDPADVTVTIACADGSSGTLTQNDIPQHASYTWALKNVTPTGFTSSTSCDGSAEITSDQPVVVVNNQNKPSSGATNTFEGASAGADTVYIPSLSNDFSGWSSALTIRKLGAGDATVTVAYDDGDPDDVFTLTDTSPSMKLYMPSFHTQAGRFGAIVTSTNSVPLLAVVGTTKPSEGWSGATSGVLAGTGSDQVAIPNVSKNYYGWISAINCQNVGSVATTLNVEYGGYQLDAYNTASLGLGASTQIQVFLESFLPASWQGGATISANTAGAEVACTVGNSGPTKAATNPGDWTSQYNAYNK